MSLPNGPGLPASHGSLPGTPSGLVYGYPFNPYPLLGGARPLHAFTANSGITLSGSDISSATNFGSKGGTWDNGGSFSAPAWTASASNLGNRAAAVFDQANAEALFSTNNDDISGPYTLIWVMDYDAASTALIIGSTHDGTTNSQVWKTGSGQISMNSGTTRTTAINGFDTSREVFVAVLGSATVSYLYDGHNGTLLAAGDNGTNVISGIALGSNNVPEATNTGDMTLGYMACYAGDQFSAASALLANLRSYYDCAGANTP